MTVLYLAIGFLSGMVVTGLIFAWDQRIKDRRIAPRKFEGYSHLTSLLEDKTVDGKRKFLVTGASPWPTSGTFHVEVEGQTYIVEGEEL